MRYYETLYIVNPNFEENRLQDIIGDITKEIGRFNFSVINHRVWGKKRLAFSVSKHKYGTYIMLQFETNEAKHLSEFETYLKLNNNILRSQTVKLDVKPEKYLEEIRKDEEEISDSPVEIKDELPAEESADTQDQENDGNESDSVSEESIESSSEETAEDGVDPELEDLEKTSEVEEEEA